jgi:hypothetical protein
MIMETLISVCVGIGLSAACGFRIFVPLLAMSMAALSGHLSLAHGFEWIGSYPALIAFSVATCLEIAGYYIPWVDHLLDSIATPAAVIAGTMVSASMVTDFSPFLRWTLAVIAGGGAAGVVQGTTVVARGGSTVTTGGLGNPLVATLELVGAVVTSAFAIFVPLLSLVLLAGVVLILGRRWFRKRRSPGPLPVQASTPARPA